MGGAAVNFFEFTKAHQEAIEKAGHINMAKRIKSIQEKLKTYLGHENLFLVDIDVQFLVKFNRPSHYCYTRSERLKSVL